MFVISIGKYNLRIGKGVGCWKDEIWLNGSVTQKVADQICSYLDTTQYDKVMFAINSGGGDTSAMDRIIDRIDEFNKERTLNTVAVGMAASAAFELFLTGKERLITPCSQLMFHDSVIDFSACKCTWTMRELREKVRWLEAISQASRIWVAHRTGLSVSALKKMTKHHKEKWFTTEECLKYKIATKMV